MIAVTEFLLYLIIGICGWLMLCCITYGLYHAVEALYTKGVLRIKDLNQIVDDEKGEDLAFFMFHPLLLTLTIILMTICSPIYLGSFIMKKIKFVTKALEKYENKELISTKSYKVKKILYGKDEE